MLQDNSSKTQTAIIVAMIGMLGVICAATIGLILPFAQEGAKKYFAATNTPVVIIVTPTQEAQPTQLSLIPEPTATAQQLVILPTVPIIDTPTSQPQEPQLSAQSNLLQNASFENGLSGWIYSERHISGLYEISGYNGSGKAYCSRQNLTASDAKGWVGFVQEVPVEGGKTYYFSAWVKLNKAIQFHGHADWYNGPSFLQIGLVTPGTGVPPNGETTNGWVFIQGTTLAPNNATKVIIGFWHGVSDDTTNIVDSEYCADDVTFGLLK